MPQALKPLLRKLEAVASLSPEEKAAILTLPVTVRQFRAGHDVIREKDRPTQCCLVLEGWVCRYKILETGTRQIFSFHIAGDIPDLQSLHLRTMDHNLGTLAPSMVAFVQHEAVKALTRDFPRIGNLLWRDTLIDAAIFREWMVGMGRRDAPAGIAHLFCELNRRLRAVGLNAGRCLRFPDHAGGAWRCTRPFHGSCESQPDGLARPWPHHARQARIEDPEIGRIV
jgi:CRP-like cAMP-binding protein